MKARYSKGGCKKFIIWMLLLLLLCFMMEKGGVEGTEIKYTPNNDGREALPLSQQQRQKLLQLEQVISQSNDPEGTLIKVAEANQMQPNELLQMMAQNKQDLGLDQAGGGMSSTAGTTWPQMLWKAITMSGLVIQRLAQKHPQTFSILSVTLFILIYSILMAPRTGIVLSHNHGIFSKTHTTMFNPPARYIDIILNSSRFARKRFSQRRIRNHCTEALDFPSSILLSENQKDDDEYNHVSYNLKTVNVGKKGMKLKQVVTRRFSLDINDFLDNNNPQQPPPPPQQQQDDNHQYAADAAMQANVYNVAKSVLLNHRFTEFTSSSLSPLREMRLQHRQMDDEDEDDNEDNKEGGAMLILPRAGNWGRFGLQSFRYHHCMQDAILDQDPNNNNKNGVLAIVYSTLKGGFFDGQLQVLLTQNIFTGNVVIQVNVIIPQGGRTLNKWLGREMVNAMVESIQRSIRSEIKSKIVRQQQGHRFQSNLQNHRAEMRQIRMQKERELEEMSAQRQRRRHNNAADNVGRYRPSGHRQQSPNNC